MGRIIIIVAAVAVAAAAFPDQAQQALDVVATWLGSITSMVTPRQQMALVIIALLFAWYNSK